MPLFPVKFGTPDATHLALPCISGASLALPPPDPSHAPLQIRKVCNCGRQRERDLHCFA